MYEIIDVPKGNPCYNCIPCMRLRLMELGFISGEKIEIVKKISGLKIVKIIDSFSNTSSTIALRDEEFDRICVREI